VEGCGKTTQINRLEERLVKHGISLITTFEPGGTDIGQAIRRILLDVKNKALSPMAELMLYAADRAQHVDKVIEPALVQGKWVLCDRFMDATVAYQGRGRRQDTELIDLINRTVTREIRPHKTFLLDCPVEVGLERALARSRTLGSESQDRFESEELEFHQKVRTGYLDLARTNLERFVVVDATQGPDLVEEEIFHHLQPYLPG
jgi:dTMP kinase